MLYSLQFRMDTYCALHPLAYEGKYIND